MGFADALYCFFASGAYTINILSTQEIAVFDRPSPALDFVCAVLNEGYCVGLHLSFLVEVHLAASCAAAIFHWVRLLRGLRGCLVLVWPVGVVLAVLEVWLLKPHWTVDRGCGVARNPTDPLGEISVGICTALTLLAYVCSLLRVRTVGQTVRHRIWDRVQYYLLAVLVCTLPRLIVLLSSSFDRAVGLHMLASASANLHPLANTLIYAVQSHYVRRIRRHQASGTGRQPATIPSKREPLSFHVGLGTADVVHVAPMSAAAMEESERETAVLEAASRPEDVRANAGMDDFLLGCFDSSDLDVVPVAPMSAAVLEESGREAAASRSELP